MNNFEKQFYLIDPWAVLALVVILIIGICLIVSGIQDWREIKRAERKEMGLPEEVK